MKVAEGKVDDNPFARTIFSLGANSFTGDLILTKTRREYRSSWESGQLVSAVSPSPADAPGRVALSNGLVNSTSLGIIVQKTIDEPNRDPLEIVTEIANLNPQQALTLKHRVLVRKAARIFALPGAEFVVDNARTMRADPNLPPLDVRWLIYFGLRTHYSSSRLKAELASVGDRGMSLPAQFVQMLPAFGFGELENIILQRLQTHQYSLANLVYGCPEVDPTTTTCVAYALMACGYLAYGENQVSRAPDQATPPPAQQPKRVIPTKDRGHSKPVGTVHSRSSRDDSGKPPIDLTVDEAATRKLIDERLAVLQSDASHYKVLGISDGATSSQIRMGYFELAKKLHPDHLQALGIEASEVQRLFAAINKAFKVLSNDKERAKYGEILKAGGEKAYKAKRKQAEDLAMKALRAEEHYSMGMMSLRRDHFSQAAKEFKQATELTPAEPEYQALYAWSYICSSKSVQARDEIAGEAMGLMGQAVLKGPENMMVKLYHAKMLKLLGRDDEAKKAFKKLLREDPDNREARLELKLLGGR
jgi:Flp pilus assembly protein TadD